VIAATAPGKLFLTGEWAVLRGAPALVMAVDRVVRVEIDGDAGDGEVAIESLAEGRTWRSGDARSSSDRDAVARGGDAGGASFPAGDAGAVVAVLRRLGALRGRIVVDSRPFLVGERKLGLGRSAATIAAAVTARRALAGRSLERAAVLDDALAANAAFQDGHGSGADVAAAVHGGIVVAEPRAGGLAVTRHELPDGIQVIAGWTGEPAPTTPLVASFATMPSPPVLADLSACARDAVAAVTELDRGRLCDAVARSAELLARFADETGLPIITPALRRLVETARRAGAAAKPSGAGGGDCGIALAPSPRVAAAVKAAWRDAGILPLDVAIAREGAARG
jgi:phosphomevalonate kinase